jgi:hypothetical protein
MTIKVVNSRFHQDTPQDIYIARPSIFGNPFSHLKSEGITQVETREEAIQKYIPHFLNLYKVDANFKEIVDLIIEQSKKEDINLVCWCAPLACHGHFIKKFIEHKTKGDNNVR